MSGSVRTSGGYGRRRPRGAALLLVLATLVLVTSAAVVVARAASMGRLQARVRAADAVAGDLLRAAEAPMLAWLEEVSPTVTLPPEGEPARVDVLHDAWTVDGLKCRLRLSAYDQCGMVGADVARSGSPLRMALPAEVRDVLDRAAPPGSVPAGLDLLAPAVRGDERVVLFPEPPAADPARFGPAADVPGPLSSPAEAEAIRPPSVGAWVASHNPGLLNVNTAPIDLLEAALRRAGRGGLDQIVDARAAGEMAVVPAADEGGPRRGRRAAGPELVAASPAWAFRIDLEVGTVHRSWWAVYLQDRNGNWECVQRLAIAR